MTVSCSLWIFVFFSPSISEFMNPLTCLLILLIPPFISCQTLGSQVWHCESDFSYGRLDGDSLLGNSVRTWQSSSPSIWLRKQPFRCVIPKFTMWRCCLSSIYFYFLWKWSLIFDVGLEIAWRFNIQTFHLNGSSAYSFVVVVCFDTILYLGFPSPGVLWASAPRAPSTGLAGTLGCSVCFWPLPLLLLSFFSFPQMF